MDSNEWTTEQPTQPGLYWAFDGDEVVPVDAYRAAGGIVVFELGDSYDIARELDEFSHWIGPLPVPAPPKEIDGQ